MGETKLEALLATMGAEEKRGLLGGLVSALTQGLSETDRQRIVQSTLAGGAGDARLSGMVDR